jgi:hypothetical protein
LTTVVVFPTPPFWFAQAIVWATQWPVWKALTNTNSTIRRPIPLVRTGAVSEVESVTG